jgi:hypothetical protein
MSTTLHLLDVTIVAGYVAALAVVGAYFSRRQTDLDHPFARSCFGRPAG